MTRMMLDSLYPLNIPVPQPAGTLIAAYLGHNANPDSYAQAVARFPGHQVVSIAAHNAVDAQVLDIESGAVDPGDYATINTWCAKQRTRGVKPTLYMNTATKPGVSPHVVGPWNWWAANWSGGPNIPPGAIGVQYDGKPGYDISIMLDYIEGIDPTGDQPAGGGTVEDGDMTPEEHQWLADIRGGMAGQNTVTLPAILTAVNAIPADVTAALPSAAGGDTTALVAAIQLLPAEVVAAIAAKLSA